MESLGIDLKLLIAQVINFGLFLFLFHRFISKPFLKFLNNEKKRDEEAKKIYEKALKQKEELEKKEKELQDALKGEREKIIDEARKEAETVKQQILDEAREQEEQMKQKTLKQIKVERENIYKDAQEKINEFSFYLVNSALKDVLTEDVRKKVTQQILKNSPKEINFNEN